MFSTNEIWPAIFAAYQAGERVDDLAARFGRNRSTIYERLHKAGIRVRTPHERGIIATAAYTTDDATRTAIIHAYKSGASAREAAALHGLSEPFALRALAAAGIDRRPPEVAHRIHTVDESFFGTIDTEAKAWLLGFMAADGYVTHNRFAIALAERDRGHLEMIRRLLGSDHPIKRGFRKPQKIGKYWNRGGWIAKMTVYSKTMAQDLIRHGITPAKSFTVRPWDGPPDLMRHFYRGVCDGDGCLMLKAGPHLGGTASVGLIGSKWMMHGFADFVDVELGHRPTIHARGKVYEVRCGGLCLAKAVARLMYEGATVSLGRKQAIADTIIELPTGAPMKEWVRVNGKLRRLSDLAREAGIGLHTFKRRLRRGYTLESAMRLRPWQKPDTTLVA